MRLPWQGQLAAYFGFLALAALLISLKPWPRSADGYIIFALISSATLMAYKLLQMNSRNSSLKSGFRSGDVIGTMGDSSSAFNIGYSLSKSIATSAVNGESLLQDLALLRKDVSRSLERMRKSLELIAWEKGPSLVDSTPEINNGTEEEEVSNDAV